MRARDVEAEHPELAAIRPAFSAEWYERLRALDIAKYPDLDQGSKDTLAYCVERARDLERSKEESA